MAKEEMLEIPVIVLGVGGVGRALLAQIVDSRERILARTGCRFHVVAVSDSRHWQRDASGLQDDALRAIVAAKKRHEPLAETRPELAQVFDWAVDHDCARGILIDVTAEDGMESLFDRALQAGWSLALANKKALAGPWQTARAYYHQPQVRHEATVGGGQPLVAILRYLLDIDDTIVRIEGQLSGTMGYICRRMDEGTPFSVALAAAQGRGYTEPDPREDLGGHDVARKLLILGRLAGWAMEAEDVDVEAVFPAALAHLDVNEFMLASRAMDPTLRDRVNAAGAAGERLRYLAQIKGGKGSVSLQAVPIASPLVQAKYLAIESERFAAEPLVLGGMKTGVEPTAAAVLGDMVGLVREGIVDQGR